MASDHNDPKGYDDSWPPVRGEYVLGDPNSGVAVVTLASLIAARGPAIIGPCKTENLGIEKIVANVISNCNIRFIIICGAESRGHLPGNTLLALHRNGIDEQGRIIGSKGAIPFIQNISSESILRFQSQVDLIDCVGLEDVDLIEELIEKYNRMSKPFPGEPFHVVKKKVVPREILSEDGDLIIGSDVVMDSSSWVIFAEG